MLVTPLPGIDPADVQRLLRTLKSDVDNLHAVGGGQGEVGSLRRLWEYLEWVDNAARRLSSTIGSAAADRLVRTHAYELLFRSDFTAADLFGRENLRHRLLNTMVSNELTAQSHALQLAITELEEVGRWRGWAWRVLLDTNVYLEHEDKLDDLDLAGLVGADDEPVLLLVPIAVVDELDRAKRNNKTRWRAAYSLARIIKAVNEAGGVLREADPGSGPQRPARGRITVEIVSTPPGHRRMPDPDDEITDRALNIQLAAGAPVTVITYDTGMSWRATAAGLVVVSLEFDPGPEPQPSTRRTTARRTGSSSSAPAT
ncbi:hypothetical protein SUDANB95_07981 (plasmid) [Actinosynnema sp. ALI-1.44]